MDTAEVRGRGGARELQEIAAVLGTARHRADYGAAVGEMARGLRVVTRGSWLVWGSNGATRTVIPSTFKRKNLTGL